MRYLFTTFYRYPIRLPFSGVNPPQADSARKGRGTVEYQQWACACDEHSCRPAPRATPDRSEDRGVVFGFGCRGGGAGAGEGEFETVSRRRAQGRRRREADRTVASRPPRRRTRLATAAAHPHRAPPEMGSRPTRQIRRRQQNPTQKLARQIHRTDTTGYRGVAFSTRVLDLGDIGRAG